MKNTPTTLASGFRKEQLRSEMGGALPAKYKGLPEGAPAGAPTWHASSTKGHVWRKPSA